MITSIFKYALIDKPKLRYNIIFSALIGSSTLSMAWFVQPYFKAVELPIPMFGILWTLLNLSVGLTSLFAYKIEAKLGKTKVVLFITIFLSGCYIFVGQVQAYWGISILFIFYLIRGFATPILKDYINKMTESNVRATVLSVRNFMIRIVFACLAPFLGWYTDTYSLAEALTFAGFFFLISGTLVSVLLIRANR